MSESTLQKRRLDLKECLTWLLDSAAWLDDAPDQPVSRPQPASSPISGFIDVRESLEWLLGRSESQDDEKLSLEEREARFKRRLELLLWILDLEPRLPPYVEERPA